MTDGDGITKVRVFGQPLHGDLVVTPVAVRELDGGELLDNVAHHGVENVEERFVGKGADLFFERVHVKDLVALRQGVGGCYWVRRAGGEGAGKGGPEGS